MFNPQGGDKTMKDRSEPKIASPIVAEFLVRVEIRLSECENLNTIDSNDLRQFIQECDDFTAKNRNSVSELDRRLLDGCKKMLNEILSSRFPAYRR